MVTFRSYRCEDADEVATARAFVGGPRSEHIDAVDERTAAMGYRTVMLQEYPSSPAPKRVRVWCPPSCCGYCYATITFEERTR